MARDPKTGYIYAVGSSLSGAQGPFVFLQVKFFFHTKENLTNRQIFNGNWAVVSQLDIARTNNAFNVVRVFGDWIYVGGSFHQFSASDSYSANIVRLNTADLSVDSMNGGVSDVVYDIVEYANNTVLVGGIFQTAGEPNPVVVNGLAIFSDTTRLWGPFHNFQSKFRSDWQVWSLDVLPDGAVVAGGFFQSVSNDTAVNNMAVYSQGAWRAVGPPGSDAPLRNFTVFSTVFTGQHEVLAFGFSGESGDNMLASYLEADGWIFDRQALLESGTVRCAALSDRYGLALGGDFVSNGTHAVRSLALWNGSAVEALAGGVVGSVRGLGFLDNLLFAVGAFRIPSDAEERAFGVFDMVAQKWSFPELEAPGSFRSFAPFACLRVVGKLVFIGGSFSFPATNVSSGAEMITVYKSDVGQFGDVAPTSTISWSMMSSVLALADNGTHVFVAGQFRLHSSAGVFFNLACLELLENRWVPLAKTCDNSDACGGDSINALAWSFGRLYVGGNFSYIGGGIRTKVDNVAVLEDNTWLQLQPGLPGQIVQSLVVVQDIASKQDAMIACGGPGFLLVFDVVNQAWVDLDPDWTFSFKVYTIFALLPFYFAKPFVSLEWTGLVIGLAVLMGLFVLVGLGIVIVLMRKRGRSNHMQEYSMLDVSAHDEDAWLIDYEALKIHNPPIG